MALSRPLAIAVAAMVLLVGSVTFEVLFHRSYAVEVHDAQGWQTIGRSGPDDGTAMPYARGGPTHPVLTERNASVEFRLRVDNGYPWASSERYDVFANGFNVEDGLLAAPARGVGEATFTIPVATLLAGQGPLAKETGATPATNVTFVSFDVQIGSRSVYASFQLQEAGK